MSILNRFLSPARSEWSALIKRPATNTESLFDEVRPIIEAVRDRGDEAALEFAKKFDGYSKPSFLVSQEERKAAHEKIAPEVKSALRRAAENIDEFHALQVSPPFCTSSMDGVRCWRKKLPIDRVGFYVPAGTAPLFSTLLMLGIPARIAGCPERVLCAPPTEGAEVHPIILFTADLVGVSKVFCIGGAQAIAALAHGTESIPKVDKIFGPGNQYVTAAKQLVSLTSVAIDMPAGPSEVAVIADASADPELVAADLLSQAEHGPDSQVMFVTTSEELLVQVDVALVAQLETLPRREMASQALSHSRAVVFDSVEEGMEFLNEYAPEHLIISTEDAANVGELVRNAGSVFLGYHTPESAGDYASGSNHVLPTNGWARAYSGVNLDSFLKSVTFQELTEKGIAALGPTIETLAKEESLEAHRRAVSLRLEKLKR